MYNKKILSLDDVKRVVVAAETEAARNQWNVVIAVVDDGGHLMYLQRERVQLGSVEVAITKARAALMFRRPTKFWEEIVAGWATCRCRGCCPLRAAYRSSIKATSSARSV
ncbi:MAG: hypothetical protein USCGTAYLOR_01027 [Chromatiales bacterium USCg_Taylor]|nr:MAG: hypothetical protein USCGTAYLOR_01027 [Chromatiales bacterium USCg_Taylor]